MGANLDFNQLYVIELDLCLGLFYVKPDNAEKIPIDELNGYRFGEFPNGKPEKFIQMPSAAETKKGLILNGYANFHLFHKSLIEAFKESGFTGWSAYPVSLYCKNGDIDKDYYAFSITGKAGDFDINKCEKAEIRKNDGSYWWIHRYYKGVYFDPETWDGSDVFRTGFLTLVTEPVMKVIKSFDLKVKICKATEYLHDFGHTMVREDEIS